MINTYVIFYCHFLGTIIFFLQKGFVCVGCQNDSQFAKHWERKNQTYLNIDKYNLHTSKNTTEKLQWVPKPKFIYQW